MKGLRGWRGWVVAVLIIGTLVVGFWYYAIAHPYHGYGEPEGNCPVGAVGCE